MSVLSKLCQELDGRIERCLYALLEVEVDPGFSGLAEQTRKLVKNVLDREVPGEQEAEEIHKHVVKTAQAP